VVTAIVYVPFCDFGFALQWFCFAAVLLCGGFALRRFGLQRVYFTGAMVTASAGSQDGSLRHRR
jgi:hypothetical protein